MTVAGAPDCPMTPKSQIPRRLTRTWLSDVSSRSHVCWFGPFGCDSEAPMMQRKWICVGCFGIVLTMAGSITWRPQAQPQDQPPPTFDVASIKPVAPPYRSGGGPWTVNHGRFRAQTAAARWVIGWAYNLMPVQVHGGPDWIRQAAVRVRRGGGEAGCRAG